MDLILVSFTITVFVTGFYGGIWLWIWLCKTLMAFFKNTLGEEDDE